MRESGRAARMMKITEEEVEQLETVLAGLESGLVTKKGSAVGLRDVIMKVKARGEEREVITNFEYLKTLSIEDFVESGIVSAPCDMCVYAYSDCDRETPTCLRGTKAWLGLEKDQDEKITSHE